MSPDEGGGAPSRRHFLAVSLSTVAVALAIPLGSAACRPPSPSLSRRPAFEEGGWLTIDTTGQVTLLVGQTELGQGVHTAMAMMVAEELGCAWERIRVQHAPADSAFDNPLMQRQRTAWSASVRGWWKPLREAGARARQMLVGAAAERWRVSPDACAVADGEVIAPDGQRATFAELAREAGQRRSPRKVELKQASAFLVIGTSVPRVELSGKTTGRTAYGLDVRLPGMQYCVIARPPYPGAIGVREDAEARAGVRVIDTPFGVAFIARSTWQAMEARRKATINWRGGTSLPSSEEIRRRLVAALDAPAIDERKEGRIDSAFADAARTVEAEYYLPYVAHVPLEPLNCTATVAGGKCHVIVPTQDQTAALAAAIEASGVDPVNVSLETVYAGGGFGRRVHTDVVREAVTVSRLAGTPIQVVWSREDDLRHDFYRPACAHRLRAALNAGSEIIGWRHAVAGQSLSGAADLPYNVGALQVTQHSFTHPLPTGIWRAVDNGPNAFAVESFLDEIAQATKQDPVALRLTLLRDQPRARAVLELATRHAGATGPKGVAVHGMVGSWVAMVITLEPSSGRIARITAAIDCGTAVHPDGVRAQVEGSIAMGLSAVLHEDVVLDGGTIVSDNLHRYRLLRIGEMPPIDIHIVPSTADPGGAGEPALPPLAPALCNAIAAATGQRIRNLPLGNQLA